MPTPEPAPSPDEPEVDPRDASISLEEVAGGFAMPLKVTHAGDGSGRLFVVEQGGRIHIVEDGEVLPEPFLDISDRTVASGEQGLLGLAFAPDYERSGRFYVDHTDTSGTTVVARYQVTDDPNVAAPGSAETLFEIDQPFANHNGGHLAFGPDGYLYIATGDGGSAGDPQGNGQRTDTLLGKLLRIDVAPPSGYDIPGDNPFAGGGGEPEIWAYGLRNPWRFSFDRATDDLWIADVGQNEIEEIDLEPAGESGGLNYGWNIMEGTSCFGADDCDTDGLVMPVAQYTQADGCSVTGGYVYRGDDVPALAGGYLYGDFCSGYLWILDAARPGRDPVRALETGRRISSFGEDEAGEVYVVDYAGTVFRIVED